MLLLINCLIKRKIELEILISTTFISNSFYGSKMENTLVNGGIV